MMKPLFDISKIETYNPHEKLPFECSNCHRTFFSVKKEVKKALRNHPTVKLIFCSKSCKHKASIKQQKVSCLNCHEEFFKRLDQIKKSENHFCSRSCSTTYNNTHKTTGNRRSKLEQWIEKELTKQFSNLEIHYNRKDAINSELDIYVPSLKLAFELNGIFHYEPIYGQEKLNQIQNNDNRKFQACAEKGISLCIIDASTLKYFKEQNAIKFLNLIKEKITLG